MKRLAFLPVFAVLVAVLLLGLYAFLPHIIRPEAVESRIVRLFEEVTENEFSFNGSRVSYFPMLGIEFQEAGFKGSGKHKVELRAKALKLRLNIIDFFLGRVQILNFAAEEGSLEFPLQAEPSGEVLEIENLSLVFNPLIAHRPVKFQADGNLAGIPKSFSFKGEILFERFDPFEWEGLDLRGQMVLKDLKVPEIGRRIPFLKWAKIEAGTLGADVEIRKSKGKMGLELGGRVALQELVYELPKEKNDLSSAVISGESLMDWEWNPVAETLVIRRMELKLPAGRFDIKGQVLLGTGEIQEMTIVGTDVVLESVPEYVILLKESIPFNLGFSGNSNLELSLAGRWDHLSIHANLDLTSAILTYARYFSKPKGIPLNVDFDFLVRDGLLLSGDISVGLKETTLKGTFTDFHFGTHEGQLNVITNKFRLEDFESLLLPLEGYSLDGKMKVLANWEGDFDEVAKLKTILNITVEGGRVFKKKGGIPVHQIHGVIDYGSMGVSVKNARFMVGDSPFEMEFSIYNLWDHPAASGRMSSRWLEPYSVFSALDAWFQDREQLKERLPFLAFLQGVSGHHFPEEKTVENFLYEFEYRQKHWKISRFDLDAYGGKLALTGDIDLSGEVPAYRLQMGVDRLSLARYLTRKDGSAEADVEGNLFLKGGFHGTWNTPGDWLDTAQGDGTWMITNGEFKTFDLLGEIAEIPALKEASQYARGMTPFNDVRAHFTLADKKITSHNILLVSEHLTSQGDGESFFDGRINFRLNVFLSTALTKDLIGPRFEPPYTVDGKQFGPVPLLLSGLLKKPELQPDPKSTAQLLEQLEAKRSQNVLRSFLPEEILFERPSSS